MKVYLHILIIPIVFLAFNCKENTGGKKSSGTEKKVEQKASIEQLKDAIVKEKKKEVPEHYEHKYVIARSGLNYRDLPNGKILGKFPLNTSLRLVKYTKISDTIEDRGKLTVGEWVGVQNWMRSDKDSDTVYVFNGFLSSSFVKSDMKLYYSSPYYKDNSEKIRTAFLNLSETYFENTYNENEDRSKNLILTENNLTNDTIRLNQHQRKIFLNKLKISEYDKVFVYLIKEDSILSFNIKDLPAIACMNPYGPSSDFINDEFDYMLGFDLGKSITRWDDNLVFVGKENPFQTGKLKPIVWTKITNKQFPITKDLEKNDIELISYFFTTEKYDYFLQKPIKNSDSYHLVIVDKELDTEVLNSYYYDSEGTYLTELNIKGNDINDTNQSQWTGELIKNKATVVFGFLGYSFGCPSITILDETEPEIPILCDNRH